jgi:hypothetical protein
LRHVAQSFAETKASRLASSRLEILRADPRAPEMGVTGFRFEPDTTDGLHDIEGAQTVRRLETGLFEVEVEVSWLPPGASKRRRCRLVTWVDREERR